jgi:thymidylate synthase
MEQLIIQSNNLSDAWTEILQHYCEHSQKDISPLVLTLNDFKESEHIRAVIEDDLKAHKLPPINTVAETIFPQSLYVYSNFDRIKLYEEYMTNYPRLQRIDSSNAQGTYFQRLISYETGGKKINQLEVIINSILNKNVKRRSKLQASIFDPSQDHKSGMFQNFPCLQHVTFYKTNEGGLVLNSFYAIQYFYRRAYGNWLGLINLGHFIAQETGLKFERLNCFVGVEHLDKITKKEARALLQKINEVSLL